MSRLFCVLFVFAAAAGNYWLSIPLAILYLMTGAPTPAENRGKDRTDFDLDAKPWHGSQN